MAFHVDLSQRAEADLDEIAAFIEADNIPQSASWFLGLTDAILSLETVPERGKLLPGQYKYRQILYGSKPHVYRIIFSVEERKRILIAHIRHGARDGSGV